MDKGTRAQRVYKPYQAVAWRSIEADLPPAVQVLEAMLKEINPPWLSFAGDLLVSPVNPLFSLVVANDLQW
jgi:hypothetical protein